MFTARANPQPEQSTDGLADCRISRAAVRYVALGDSYTIGTSVGESERWPNQLVERARRQRATLELVANLGVNGYTSARPDRRRAARSSRGLEPDFVTVLIGVNDVVQRVPKTTYRRTSRSILGALLAALPARADRDRRLDARLHVHAAGCRRSGSRHNSAAEIARFNDVMRAACAERGIRFVSIDRRRESGRDEPRACRGRRPASQRRAVLTLGRRHRASCVGRSARIVVGSVMPGTTSRPGTGRSGAVVAGRPVRIGGPSPVDRARAVVQR